jgi:hypothetical protein
VSTFKLVLLVSALLIAPSAGAAQESHAHQHEGLFLRMTLGPAVGGTSYGSGSDQSRTLGAGAMTEVAVGYTIAPNFILHAHLNLAHVTGHRKPRGGAYGSEDVSTVLGFFGAGATYYFMPYNVYLTGALGVGGLSQTQGPSHEDFESDTGFGTSFSIGKEWWLSQQSNWAMGAALTGSYYQAPFDLDGRHSTYRGHSLGVMFSSTYN